MRSPKISVIIASYNHEKYVVQSIESVLQQTFQDFEIIITDDGSEDATVEQIKTISDPRIKLFCFDVNQGACAATNNSIMHASGEFVAILNSDDFWTPDKLEIQIDFLQQHNDISAVFSNAQFVDKDGKDFQLDKRPTFFEIFEQNNRSQGQWLKRFFLEGNCLCHPSILIRKDCYNILGMLDNRYRQLPDFDLWIRFCKRFKLHVLPEKMVRFRLLPEGQNASNQTKTNRTRDINEFYFIMQRFFDDMPIDVFRDGFSEYVRNPLFNGSEEYECEKVFVYLNCTVPWYIKCYHLIAFQKLYHMLENETFKRILKEKYSFDENSFMTLSPDIDFLAPQIINTPEINLTSNISFQEYARRINILKTMLLKPVKALYSVMSKAGLKDNYKNQNVDPAGFSTAVSPPKQDFQEKKSCPVCKSSSDGFIQS